MIVLGLVLVGAGMLLGLAPSTVTSQYVTVDCGSPWSPSRQAARQDTLVEDLGKAMSTTGVYANSSYAEQCEDARGSRGGWGVALSALGALALLGMGFLYLSQRNNASGEAHRPVELGAVDER